VNLLKMDKCTVSGGYTDKVLAGCAINQRFPSLRIAERPFRVVYFISQQHFSPTPIPLYSKDIPLLSFHMITKLTLSLLFALSGCASTQLTNADPSPSSPPPPPPAQIILDGDLSDWYNQTGIRADNDELFICFDSFDESQAIQAADFTTRIRIDADDDPTTGRRQMYQPQDQGMMLSQGIDLTIDISPAGREFGTLRGGAKLTQYTTTDSHAVTTQKISHADAGFYFLPTHNAPRYEARIDRTALPILQHNGSISIVVEHLAIGGDVLKTQSFTTTLPRYYPSKPINDPIAPNPTNGLRIMSTNVLFSSPLKNPEPFERVIDALDPDAILYQEWFKTTQTDVRDWIDEHLGKDWSLIMMDDRSGVAIATRLKVVESITKPLIAHGSNRPSRVVAAVVESNDQYLILVSLHLKCCGGAGSDEDAKRIAQAHQINGLLLELREKYPDAGIVIGGDFNLVGTRTPLEILTKDIGINQQDLTPVPTIVLGTQSMLTWTDADSSYTPGRLDWLLVDDHAWTPIRSWSLDTARLNDHALKNSGLERDDSRATDHLPIVVDLVPVE